VSWVKILLFVVAILLVLGAIAAIAGLASN
jgi:hypothetical protein